MQLNNNLINQFPNESQPLILHIPHSSTIIPDFDGFISHELAEREIKLLTDWYTDEIFSCEDSIEVKASFSRVFCDVERFQNDELEPMAVKGMSLTYTKCDDGTILRTITSDLRKKIEKDYYEPHHELLQTAVDTHLELFGKCKIIDCHSYPDIPLNRDINKTYPRPDFNIGISKFHTPNSWIELSKHFFENRGYSLGIDWPYSGCIVPLKYLETNSNVKSVMLEINRKLYLRDNSIEKSEKFEVIKNIVKEWLEEIRNI